MPDYVDSHCHIHFSRYDNDRNEVLARMRENNIWAIVVGTDKKQSQEALEFAQKHDGIYATVGLHPADNTKESFEEPFYETLISDKKTVMVGECGLDYYHIKEKDERARQRKEFEKQIEFAVLYDKPLMLHVREAHKDALDILKSKKKEYGDRVRGNTHFFTESPDIAKQYYELEFTTSFPGVITFTNEYDDTVRYAPSDTLLSETDSPYAAPVPYRGKRNEPSYVIEVVRRMADIRNEDVEKLKKQLVKNAFRVLGIKN